MRTLILGTLLLSACTDAAIEMTLQLPDANRAMGMDISCIEAVDAVAIGDGTDANNNPIATHACFNLPHAATTYPELISMVHGQIALAMPTSPLVGVDVTGIAAHCEDQINPFVRHESMFYAGAAYKGADSMPMKLIPNISCQAKQSVPVKTVDLLDAGACAVPNQIDVLNAIVYRFSMLDGSMVFDRGAEVTPAADGTGTVSVYPHAVSGCVGLEVDGLGSHGGNCRNPDAPKLCATAGQDELGAIDWLVAENSRDGQLAAQFGEPIFGAVWTGGTTKAAIAGATVTLDDPSVGTVVYVDPSGDHLTPNTGKATSASGLFIVYAKKLATITVSAPGKTAQHYTVASTGYGPSTLLAVLN